MMKVVFIYFTRSQWGREDDIFRFFISDLPDWMLKFIKLNPPREIIYRLIELTFSEQIVVISLH